MQSPAQDRQQNAFINQNDRPRRRILTQDEQLLIRESRLKDLDNIRKMSFYSLIPLLILSFAGGYTLSHIILKPLEKLNKEIKRKEVENLNKQIEFPDKGDEISELLQSFNNMNKKLHKAFEGQKQFVENASHEIKHPLSVIKANLDTIQDQKGMSQKQQNELIKNASKQIKTIDYLTEDLLLLSHINSKIGIQFKKTNLIKLLENVKETIKDKTKKVGIEINLKNNTDKENIIYANQNLLERALINILDNSIKYSKGDKINIIIGKKNENLEIKISDNGKGINKKYAKNIFDRFYRIDRGRSREQGGSGLGLAITKEVIELHNGVIKLDTGYKKGTRFIISFGKHKTIGVV